jgi:hypothetical protein
VGRGLFAYVADLLGTPMVQSGPVECVCGFIGNRRTVELHDPSRSRRVCQLDEIVEPWPLDRVEGALAIGYDGCAFCIPEHHTR